MDHNGRKGEDSAFSFGVRELRRAAAAEPQSLKVVERSKTGTPKPGFDPYNTSGSFDRKKNWNRVGKR